MEHSNHWYGHSRVLADYCGMPPGVPPRVWGALQHGWNIEHGFGPRHYPHPGFPRLVWSDIAARRGQARGWREYAVIGAPWAYLLTLRPAPPPATERSGTIFYPFHTWDHGSVSGAHHRLIAQVRETESEDVTACLYWLEYDDPEIRDQYERAGFRVICHGRRGKTRHDVDTEFLARQHAELTAHRRVVSNRLTTAVLYGISVGCEAGVYGDPMTYQEAGYTSDSLTRVRRMYPELHTTHIDPSAGAEFARSELGLDRLAHPVELRELLGWAA